MAEAESEAEERRQANYGYVMQENQMDLDLNQGRRTTTKERGVRPSVRSVELSLSNQ